MINARKVSKLGDLVSFKTGKLDSNAAKPNGAYPFFTCSQETLRTDSYSFDAECVLLAGNNANGIYPLKYYSGKFDAYQRTYVLRSLDPRRLLNRYLYYALRPQLELLKSISTGAATKFLTLTLLKELEIDLPHISTQERFVHVLSGYDDLIENNTRRIKILEEMAQALYREWFVHFRFPGPEKVKFVDGRIPQGWALKRLADLCDIVMGQSPRSEFYNTSGEGLPFHQGVTAFGERFPIDHVYCTVENRVAEKGDILCSVRAPVGRLNIANKKIVIGRGLCAIRSKTGNQPFVFQQLREKFREEDSMGGGTIFKAVTKGDMHCLQMLSPPAAIRARFDQCLRPMFRELENLTSRNFNLRRTRDLLLPKLISGEIQLDSY
jgi:type I restriction enzyme S subunit